MSDDTRPNILVMLTDDHGQWASGCYGNSEIHSPSMDWLADHGVRMENAMTATPVCSPARASFWTGLYPSQHGIHDYIGGGDYRDGPWIESEVQLGRILSAAGYRCGFFGKWHCGTPEDTRPGFDDWFCVGRRTGPHHGEQRYIHNGAEHVEAGYQARITTDAALAFLQRHLGRDESRSGESSKSGAASAADGRQPFFAFIGLVATHSPYADHPPRLVDSYRDARFHDIPRDPVHPFGRITGEGKNAAAADRRVRQAQYYAAVSEIDEQLGRVLDYLDQTGQLENTLVVYTSDHGLNVGHHGLFGKGNATRPLNMLEESIRIPMIFGGWSSLFGRQVRTEFVDHADLFQTLVDAAGADRSASSHAHIPGSSPSASAPSPDEAPRYLGRSFLPLLTRASSIADWKRIQIGEYGDLRMARSSRYKLIRRHGRGRDQFFDLDLDPRETTNAIDDPVYAERIDRLDGALNAAFAPMADSPKNGLLVESLRAHNSVEAWRGEPK